MMRKLLPAVTMLIASGLLVVLAACGDDDSGPDLTPSPTASGPSDTSSNVAGVEAAQRYLQETGIDGKRGAFADPRSCAEIDDHTEGVFCVHEDFSTYAAGLVILRIAKSDKPDGDVWEMRLALTDGAWQVTSVEPFGENQ